MVVVVEKDSTCTTTSAPPSVAMAVFPFRASQASSELNNWHLRFLNSSSVFRLPNSVTCTGTGELATARQWKFVLAPTVYLYDGPGITANIVEEMDNSGTMLARYTHGRQVDEPLAQLRDSTATYYEQDGLASITSLSDGIGGLANSYTYDSFGKLTASTGTLINPFQYTARDYDAETGLRYYRARYYDAYTGRFLAEDTIGNDEGSNLYAYVSNSAVNSSDPTGLYSLKGFPPEYESRMRDAIQAAIDKLREGCQSCAGPKAPKIIHALQTAKFIYKPDLEDCGGSEAVPLIHLFNHIEIGYTAFDSLRCCSLASTLTHEAAHLGAGAGHTGSGNAYQIEKDCFNCGTGHEPPKPPKPPKR